jgi:enediyne polyketide synthase
VEQDPGEGVGRGAAARSARGGDQGDGGVEYVLDARRDLYGGLLFHRGRFQRLGGYRELRATACFADIIGDGTAGWFAASLPGQLLLGDPGARDAAIHGIQACIPHSLLLPVGVERIVCARLPSDERLSFRARERRREGVELIYDLDILDCDGNVRERWEGLRLRAVDRPPAPEQWTAALLAPYVERRLDDLLPGAAVRVALAPAPGKRAQHADAASAALVRYLLGEEAILRHRPDGKPETGGGWHVSLAHAPGLLLAVTAERSVGCDLEPVAERSPEVWRQLLGDERYRLAEAIAGSRGEGRDAAATRVWTVAESLTKAGAPPGAPLVLEQVDEKDGADGWLLLRSGRLRIGSLVAPMRDLQGPAALAILTEA